MLDTTRKFIIFLDFDGVLHPGTSGTMRYAEAFAELLQEFQQTSVVVSSTWRRNESLEDLKGWFPRGFSPRIIDVTPDLGVAAVRQREVEAWVQRHGCSDWLAVDDEPALFDMGCPRLFLVEPRTGLDATTMTKLRGELVRRGAR